MSEKTSKQDRRTRYTRQSIKETFLELLKQKNFTKITVTEICKISEQSVDFFFKPHYSCYYINYNNQSVRFVWLLNTSKNC